MGWWSTDIIGGDTPYDVKDAFERQFGGGVEGWDNIPARTPTAEEGEAFMLDYDGGYDAAVSQQVIGYLLMVRGSPMTRRVRQMTLQGVDDELETGCTSWVDPQERIDALMHFRSRVEAYPEEGGVVEMPKHTGLVETIFRNFDNPDQ